MPVGSEHFSPLYVHVKVWIIWRGMSLPIDITTMARFHGMREQRFNFDDLALAWPCWGHARVALSYTCSFSYSPDSSTQAPSVTTMLAVPDRTEPSLISARASTVCDRARRIRVLISAFPARTPR